MRSSDLLSMTSNTEPGNKPVKLPEVLLIIIKGKTVRTYRRKTGRISFRLSIYSPDYSPVYSPVGTKSTKILHCWALEYHFPKNPASLRKPREHVILLEATVPTTLESVQKTHLASSVGGK